MTPPRSPHLPSLRHAWSRSWVSSGVLRRRDRRVLQPALTDTREAPYGSPPAGAEPRHVVLAAPGGGNVGGQAMLEALLETTVGPVTVVVGDASPARVPGWATDRVRVVAAPHLLDGTGAEHQESLRVFAGAVSGATHFSVIGADLMDGRYSLRGSVTRATLAAAVARSGVDSRILGFSWNATARRAARTAVREAGRAGVRLLLRDPVSAARAEASRIPGVERSADLTFVARAADRSVARRLAPPDRPLALVNASGRISASLDQVEEYVRIVRHLRAAGLHVVLLPHVSRVEGDDVPVGQAIGQAVGSDGVTVVSELFTPAQVRGLAAAATLVVTGRMHLAVLALGTGVPAVTLATQGKVEGLMEMFGTPELCVVPRPGFADAVTEVADRVLPAGSTARRTIAWALPGVVALAERNLAGLPRPETRPDRSLRTV